MWGINVEKESNNSCLSGGSNDTDGGTANWRSAGQCNYGTGPSKYKV